MASAHYNRAQLADAVRAAGVGRGDTLFSHSNVGFFGRPQGAGSMPEACALIREALFDVLGPEGTLVVPTFTYSFGSGQTYDAAASVSNCGAFAEHVRLTPGALRSEDPSISVAALGAQARALTERAPENAYGPGSFFERFLGAGGKVCNLNFDAGSTFVHYVERELRVPYRFDKTFTGTVRRDGVERAARSTLWVRDLSSDETQPRFEPFDALARAEGLFRTAPVGRGFVGAISARDVFELIRATLPARPWLLTRAGVTGVIPRLAPEPA